MYRLLELIVVMAFTSKWNNLRAESRNLLELNWLLRLVTEGRV